jgi:hypothetical protein
MSDLDDIVWAAITFRDITVIQGACSCKVLGAALDIGQN